MDLFYFLAGGAVVLILAFIIAFIECIFARWQE